MFLRKELLQKPYFGRKCMGTKDIPAGKKSKPLSKKERKEQRKQRKEKHHTYE